MLQTKSINKKVVAVSWDPGEIFVRSHGKSSFNHEELLVSLKEDGTLHINQDVADKYGIKIDIGTRDC